MQVEFMLIHPDAKMPERGHGIDVGLDVFTPEGGVLFPGPNKISLGFSVDVPVGWCAAIYPRSGMASGEKTINMEVSGPVNKLKMPIGGTFKVSDCYSKGIAILAQMPPIDPGYRGIVHAIVVNCSDLYVLYDKHTRFGQLVFVPMAYVQPVSNIDTSRGTSGFGSSGTTGGFIIND